MDNNMKGILVALVVFMMFLSCATLSTKCQDKNQPDTIKIHLGYSNLRSDDVNATFGTTTIPIGIIESHAVTGTASVKALSRSRFSFRFAGEFSTNINRSRFHQYSGGTQVFFKLFENRVEPFGELLFGVHRTEDGQNHFLKTYGGGLDVRVTPRFGFRAFQYDRQAVDLFPKRLTKLSTGIFVVF